MVIPKRHVDSLANLSDEEKIDYMNQVARFDLVVIQFTLEPKVAKPSR